MAFHQVPQGSAKVLLCAEESQSQLESATPPRAGAQGACSWELISVRIVSTPSGYPECSPDQRGLAFHSLPNHQISGVLGVAEELKGSLSTGEGGVLKGLGPGPLVRV
jgi:hypothetical protein